MEHQSLKLAGDIGAWVLLAAAVKGLLPTIALILGIGWHLYQFYCAFEKRMNKRKSLKRRATDNQ